MSAVPKLEAGRVVEIPIAKIKPDPSQPRRSIEEKALAQLAASIAAIGVLSPITVRPEKGGYVIVTGERRWRASKLAKLKTVPCILSAAELGVELAAVQIAENVHRENLNVMDIAEFLADLQKSEGKSATELQTALVKLGNENAARARIDKLVQFPLLPAWVRNLLRSGELLETHAVCLLPCLDVPTVLEALEKHVSNAINWRGQITVRELQGQIEGCYRTVGIDLNAEYPADRVRAFPLDACKGCEHLKALGKKKYCMNPAGFEEKQKTALDLQAQRATELAERKARRGEDRDDPDPTKVKPRKLKEHNGVVMTKGLQYDTYKRLTDAKFDVETCAGCPHKKLSSYNGDSDAAEETCFHVPCFELKQRAGRRVELHGEKIEEYLDKWLRPRLLEVGPTRATPEQYKGLVLWLATGAPDSGGYQDPGKAAERTRSWLSEHKVGSLPAVAALGPMLMNTAHRSSLARCAIEAMDAPQLRWFARWIGFDLKLEGFVIDRAYLDLQRRAALLELAKIGELEHARGSVDELKTRILNSPGSVDRISVPEDIGELYAREWVDRSGVRFQFEDDDEELGDVDDEELAAALSEANEELAADPLAKPKGKRK